MRSPFDPLADAYDAARPAYPTDLYDAVDRLAGPLAGARVAEVGAGTGIATRGLLDRGADVVAFDIAPAMLDRLRAHRLSRPGRLLGVALGDGHALPLRENAADVVAYAQAFHWMRPDEAVREARRVLRPGGALALWWNNSGAHDEKWWRAQADSLMRRNPGYTPEYRDEDPAPHLAEVFGTVLTATTPWTRTLPVEDYLVYLSSKSYVAAIGADLPAFLDEQRVALADAFPDGVVTEPMVTRLWVAR